MKQKTVKTFKKISEPKAVFSRKSLKLITL
jgi:hypothetical protein